MKKRKEFAYMMARIGIGLSFFGHGLIRIINLAKFSDGMVKQFSKSILPETFVSLFGHVLPFLELVTGLLLLLGLFTRIGLLLGWLILLSLVVGSSIIQEWNAIFTQLFYVAYLSVLYCFLDYNRVSVDGKWRVA